VNGDGVEQPKMAILKPILTVVLKTKKNVKKTEKKMETVPVTRAVTRTNSPQRHSTTAVLTFCGDSCSYFIKDLQKRVSIH
jgi:hypothetical protein